MLSASIFSPSYNNNIEYKKNNSFEVRKSECQRILSKYINYIPVIVSYDNELSKYNLKKKFLVPTDVTCSHLIYTIRKSLKLNSTIGIFIFCNNTLIGGNKNMSELYEEYKDEDQFLYICACCETTFGN